MDRGFLFGDGVYEAVPVYGGRLFRVADHLTRLEHSLQQVRLPNPYEREQWLALMARIVAQTAEATGAQDQLLYLQITRGAAPDRYIVPPLDLDPTVFMMSQPHTPPSAAQRHHGVAAVTARDLRWSRGNIKSISLLGNVLARQAATDHNAVETIMVHDGWLTEGASSNVWVVFEDALLTPAAGRARAGGRAAQADPRVVRGRKHPLQYPTGARGRALRRVRGHPVLGWPRGAAGDHAGR